MHETYTYRWIRIERGGWRRVAEAVHGSVATSVGSSGGRIFGLFRGEIGWHNDEGALIVGWEDEPDHDATATIPGVIDSSVEPIVATVRPTSLEGPTGDGIYAHRWFETTLTDWPEFLELSESAWPTFEDAFEGTRIIGFWRSEDVAEPRCRVLLVTRYPSLAAWEGSRPYHPEAPSEAEEARRRFLRRAELTERTIVRVTRLLRS